MQSRCQNWTSVCWSDLKGYNDCECVQKMLRQTKVSGKWDKFAVINVPSCGLLGKILATSVYSGEKLKVPQCTTLS